VHISFALFADGANLSQEGKLNLLGIFDALQVTAFPSVHPRAHFVVRLKGSAADAGTHTLTFRWMNPRGNELWTSTGELRLDAAADGASAEMDLPVIAVIDLPMDMSGRYAMHVELSGNAVSTVNLFVNGPAPALGYTGRSGALPS
jgi:hypothetical protein